MFQRLFKPKWQHGSEQVRFDSLGDLADQSDNSAIISLVENDPSMRIRLKAVALIRDLDLLQDLFERLNEPKLKLMAFCTIFNVNSQRAMQLIKDVLALSLSNPALVIEYLDRYEVLEGVLWMSTHLDSAEWQSLYLLTGKFSEAKILIIDNTNDLSRLNQWQKSVQQKTFQQRIRETIKQIKLAEKHQKQNSQRAMNIVDALQRCARLPWDNLYQANIESLEQQWNELDCELPENILARFENELSACRQVVVNHQKLINQKRQAEESELKATQLCAQLERCIDELRSEPLDSVQSIRDATSIIDKNWIQLQQENRIEARYKGQFEGLKFTLSSYFAAWERYHLELSGIDALIETVDKQEQLTESVVAERLHRWEIISNGLQWPVDLMRPKRLEVINELIKQWTEQLTTINRQRKESISKIHQKISALENKIRQKNLISANRLYQFLLRSVEKTALQGVEEIVSRMDKIKPELEELRDWHQFATIPKKQFLIQQMNDLTQSEQHPLELARQIHALQSQWRELNSSDNISDNLHWEEFKEAMNSAYQPCLEYYQEQDQIKANNLTKARAICEQVEQLEQLMLVERSKHNENQSEQSESKDLFDKCSSINSMWKKLDQDTQNLKNSWSQVFPLPENEIKQTKSRFDIAYRKIFSALKAEKQKNSDLKKDLVERAKQLLTEQDLSKAIREAKELQRMWKLQGITFVKSDRQQWQAFRRIMDSIFAKQKEQKEEIEKALRANFIAATINIEKIFTLARLDDEALLQSYAEFEVLRKELAENFALSTRDSIKIKGKVQKAINVYLEQYNGIGQRKILREWKLYRNWLTELNQFDDDFANERMPDLESVANRLKDSQLRAEYLNVIENRLNQLRDESVSIDQENQIEQLQSMVLEAEILSEVDSPNAFQERRMALQLKLLQTSIGHRLTEAERKERILELFESASLIGKISAKYRNSITERLDIILKKAGL